MRRIVDYILIEGAHTEQIESSYEELKRDNFEPFGPPSVTPLQLDPNSPTVTPWIIQAFVRYAEGTK